MLNTCISCLPVHSRPNCRHVVSCGANKGAVSRQMDSNNKIHSPCRAASLGTVRVNLQCGRAATARFRAHRFVLPFPSSSPPSEPPVLSFTLIPSLLPSLPCLLLTDKRRDNKLRFCSSSHRITSRSCFGFFAGLLKRG